MQSHVKITETKSGIVALKDFTENYSSIEEMNSKNKKVIKYSTSELFRNLYPTFRIS